MATRIIEPLDRDADERLLALLGADRADAIPPHLPHRRWSFAPFEPSNAWQRLADRHWRYDPPPESPRPPGPHRWPQRWPPLPAPPRPSPPLPAWIAEALNSKQGYRNMGDVADDARLFIYGIGSRYFAEVVSALHAELSATDPPQALVLDRLCGRLIAMRDLLEQRLRELPAEPGADRPDRPSWPREEEGENVAQA